MASTPQRPEWLRLSDQVEQALARSEAVVALESTVLAHGLPRPRNLEVGIELEDLVRSGGAVPATVAVLDGAPTIGLSPVELERIAMDPDVVKLSTRDLPLAIARRTTGSTTVAATAFLSAQAGIDVFATGGIGGVHRGLPPDVSADLIQLHRTPIIVVCAGAKSILDLAATRELLETLGVLVLGWKTDRFPAFYTAQTELTVDARVNGAAEVAAVWVAQRRLGMEASILLCAPLPAPFQLPAEVIDGAIELASGRAAAAHLHGKAITPYLLGEIATITEGASLAANVALLRNNATIAVEIATELMKHETDG